MAKWCTFHERQNASALRWDGLGCMGCLQASWLWLKTETEALYVSKEGYSAITLSLVSKGAEWLKSFSLM